MLSLNRSSERFHAAVDANEMRVRFQQQLMAIRDSSIEMDEFHISRVFPRANGAFNIQYQIRLKDAVTGSPQRLILYGHLLGPSENWPNYLIRCTQKTILFKDLRLVVPLFPFDPELPVISDIWPGSEISPVMREILDAVVGKNVGLKILNVRVLGYRLERRCVLAYTIEKGYNSTGRKDKLEIVVKIARPKKLKAALKSIEFLNENGFDETAGRLAVPKTLYSDVDKGLYVMELSPGESLHSLTGSESFNNACGKAAELLKKLHSLAAGGFAEYSHETEIELLKKRVVLVNKLYPGMSKMFDSTFCAVELCARRVVDRFKRSCIHRDFYDKQVLYSEEQTTLLDCDSLALGDPAQDYGNFVAHMRLRQLQEPDNAEKIEKGIGAFSSSYQYRSLSFDGRARWWEAASLLRLAILYALRPRWHKLAVNLVHKSLVSLPERQTYLEGADEKSTT